ncbi:MAG: hypothetical protein ABFS39_17300, partial [Pseudomonadota bacterium]
ETIAELLIMQGVNLDAKDKRGQTALDRAEKEGHRGVAAILIAHGAKAGRRSEHHNLPVSLPGSDILASITPSGSNYQFQ